MHHSAKAVKIVSLMLSVAAWSACGSKSKSNNDRNNDKKTTAVVPPRNSGSNTPANGSGGTVTNPPVSACSSNYLIAGTANPFLAGAAVGTELKYDREINDTAAVNAPVNVVPDLDSKCLAAGQHLYFQVSGKIAYDDQNQLFSDADGQVDDTPSHALGSVFGLSNIKAPINSLVAVFLDDTAFAARPVAPPTLDFSTLETRNFTTLNPLIGQIFFIGDGKTSSGALQAFVVPAGTTRLYLAIMDRYEWANNQGQLSGTIQWVKP